MQASDRTFNGPFKRKTLGVTTVGENQRLRLLLAGSNLLVQGDKRKANPFSFASNKLGGISRVDLTSRYSGGKPYLDTYEGWDGANMNSTAFRVGDFARTAQDAWTEVYDQLRGDSSILIDLAESSQTIRMLKSTLNLKKFAGEFFTEFLFAPRKGRKTSGQARLDYLTRKWLEVRYGWTPLVHSIYDAVDLIAKRELERLVYVRGRAKYVDKVVSRSGSGSYSNPSTLIVSSLSARTEIGAYFKLPSTSSGKIYDWTSLNPAKIAWELLPLSFVADWLVNVSQVLDLFENYWLFNTMFAHGYSTNSSAESVVQSAVGSTKTPQQYFSNGIPVDMVNFQFTSRKGIAMRTELARTVLNTLPYPPSALRIRVKIGAKRQLDAAALFHQLVGARLR